MTAFRENVLGTVFGKAACSGAVHYQRSVLSIEGLTDLDFGELHQFDGFSNEEDDRGEVVRRLITGPEDILV
jgi:hypothetical protein